MSTGTLFMVSVNDTDLTHFTIKGAARIARIIAESVGELQIPLSGAVRYDTMAPDEQ